MAFSNYPECSWDSQWLAIQSRDGGVVETYVVDAAGGFPQATGYAPRGSWPRDMRWFYTNLDPDGILRMPAEGGEPM